MEREYRRAQDPGRTGAVAPDRDPTPGKRTLTGGAQGPAAAGAIQRSTAAQPVGERPGAPPATAAALRSDPARPSLGALFGRGAGAAASAPASATGMPAAVQRQMESYFGADFSTVRVQESALAQQANAVAYTQGEEIHFAPGRFQPHTPEGLAALGHELAHVVQQRQGRVRATGKIAGMALNDDAQLEREAEQQGRAAAAHTAPADAGPRGSGGGPASRSGPIQRLMGIEAEFSIPVWFPGPIGNAVQRVESFVTGGMQEGTVLAASAGAVSAGGNGFTIETDHDGTKTTINNHRKFLKGHVGAGPMAKRNPGFLVGNLEYKTDPPCDEETPAGRQDFRQSVLNMVADMNARWANRNVPALVGGAGIVGMPSLADYLAYGVANGIPAGAMTAMHQELTNQVRRNLYVQVTAGITPRRLTRHLRNARNNPHVMTANQMANPNLAMDLVTTGSIQLARQALHATPGLTGAIRRSKSLHGYLSLVVSYLFGNYLTRGANVTDIKNICFFLSKTPLTEVLLEIDQARRPDLWPAGTRNALVAQIAHRVVARVTQPDVTPYWNPALGGTHNNGALGNWQVQWLPEVLAGRRDRFSYDAFAGDHRDLEIDDHARSRAIQHGGAIQGRSHGRGPNGGPGLDRPAGRQAPAPVRSGAIPLEFRHVETMPDPNNLLALVDRMIAHVRRANR